MIYFFRPFRLSLTPTICPWVSKDVEIAAAQTSGVANLFSLIKQCSIHLFINNLLVVTELAVPSTWQLGLHSTWYLSNKKPMLDKDLTQFMQSFSHIHQNRASEKKKSLLAERADVKQIINKHYTHSIPSHIGYFQCLSTAR